MIDMPTADEPVRIIEGDCLDVLPLLPTGCVNAVVTDPPYGTDVPRDGYGRRQLWNATRRIEGDGDLSTMAAGLAGCNRTMGKTGWVICFASPKRHAEASAVAIAAGYTIHGEVVWDKAMPGLGGGIRYQHELVMLLGKGDPQGCNAMFSVIRIPRVAFAVHPHEKPLGLIRELVQYATRPGDIILDPFAGSGTTGVAAVAEGRRCILIERDPAYATIARRRVAEAMGTAPGQLFGAATMPQADLFEDVR